MTQHSSVIAVGYNVKETCAYHFSQIHITSATTQTFALYVVRLRSYSETSIPPDHITFEAALAAAACYTVQSRSDNSQAQSARKVVTFVTLDPLAWLVELVFGPAIKAEPAVALNYTFSALCFPLLIAEVVS
jgi:hypothetical protein